MLRICTELFQKTAHGKLLSFLIYNVTNRQQDRQKEAKCLGSSNIIHIYKSGQKSNLQWREFREIFLDIRIYFVIHFQLKSGCYQKCLRFMSVFTGLMYYEFNNPFQLSYFRYGISNSSYILYLRQNLETLLAIAFQY